MKKRRSLPELAMSRPVTVSMLLITLIGLGAIAAQRTAVEFMPPMDLPFLGAFIPYLGATPAQVEQEIAIPAEGQFRTLPNLREMYTSSSGDGCFISLNFEWGTDMTDALSEVRDRMERLRLVGKERGERRGGRKGRREERKGRKGGGERKGEKGEGRRGGLNPA